MRLELRESNSGVAQIGQHTYLAGDYSLRCDTDTWRFWAGLAGAAFVVYVLGVPWAFWAVVRRARGANVDRYLSILKPYLASIARANRMQAAMESIEVAAQSVGKLRMRSAAGGGAKSEGKTSALSYLRVGRPEHDQAASRARRAFRTAAGDALDLRGDDLTREAVALVRDADALQTDMTVDERRAASMDEARLMRRMADFLGEDNLASTWVTQRCGFIFENYQRKLWWFENVRAPVRGWQDWRQQRHSMFCEFARLHCGRCDRHHFRSVRRFLCVFRSLEHPVLCTCTYFVLFLFRRRTRFTHGIFVVHAACVRACRSRTCASWH